MKWLTFAALVIFASAVGYAGHSRSYFRTVERTYSAASGSNGSYTASETVTRTRSSASSNGTHVPRRIVTRTKTRSSAASSGTYGSVQRTVKRTSYGSSGK
jgi:hypothetical protein